MRTHPIVSTAGLLESIKSAGLARITNGCMKPVVGAFAGAVLLSLPAGGSVRWELSGTLNYVNPLLAGTFSVGQQFTISMDLDDSVPVSNGQRIDFYTSGGSFNNAVSNGSVTFPNYAAGFASTANHGAIQVRNNETAAPFGYDQLQMSFFSYEPGAVTAPQAGGHNLQSVEFNFYSDLSPRDMITGAGGSFPAIDVPFPGPDSFRLARSNNPIHQFILRFSGGAVEGTNFIRGTINSSGFVPAGGGGFADWSALAELPENQRGTLASPAGDGVPNLIKYAIGIGPLESAIGRIPQEVLESKVGDESYPTVCFVRDTKASGVTLHVDVAANLNFTTDLGTTVVSTEDLGNGLERVCVRSNARFSEQTRQFFRLRASEE
jgi:hypothetical protein